jgi:hypothetical protein
VSKRGGQPSAVSGLVLENNFLRVEFNPAGDITRIFDKKVNREVLAPNAIANQFQVFEDRPKSWDAWDLDIFYDDKMWRFRPGVCLCTSIPCCSPPSEVLTLWLSTMPARRKHPYTVCHGGRSLGIMRH